MIHVHLSAVEHFPEYCRNQWRGEERLRSKDRQGFPVVGECSASLGAAPNVTSSVSELKAAHP